MSSGGSNPQPESPKPLNLKPARIASNERAIPLPYFAGEMRLGIHWLGECYNDRAEEVESKSGGGKGGGGSQTVGYEYFADVVGAFCHGPVDQIREVWSNAERIWVGSVSRAVGEDFTEITLDDYGMMRLYWGTETQGIDLLLDEHDHPAYRGQCYAVFEQLFFGRDRTEAPNIEVVLRRAPVAPGLSARIAMSAGDANPIHCMVELLLNKRFGLGVTEEDVEMGSFDSASQQVMADGIVVSPVVTEAPARDRCLGAFAKYFDGYLGTSSDNRISLGLNRAPEGPIPVIGEFDMVELPSLRSDSWADTVNEVAVKFTDRPSDYEEDTELWRDEAGGPNYWGAYLQANRPSVDLPSFVGA